MGGYLDKPKTEKETHTGSNNGIEFAMSCMQGWREEMEDAHICEPNFDNDTQLYAVFDGHCGFEVAEFISKHFAEELRKNDEYKKKNFSTALKQTFLEMDDLLITESAREEIAQLRYKNWLKKRADFEKGEWREQQKLQYFRKELTNAGCTANVVLLHNNQLYVANAGDSRCVLSSDGVSVDLSKDHKPDDPIEYERITKAKGSVSGGRVNGNLNLSRALGDLSFKQNYDLKPEEQQISPMPDIVNFKLSEKDEFLLIGCDGVWELKTNQELISICRRNLADKIPMTQIVENLLDEITAKDTNTGKGCDNMSMILVKIKQNIVINDNNNNDKNDGDNNFKNNSEDIKKISKGKNRAEKKIENLNNLNY